MINKTAMITIAGQPNVGKSTLTNYLVGEKITIVSPKPQTTRNRILAVTSREDIQFVFIDTPGYHKARTKLGNYMDEVVRHSVADVDAIMFLVEPTDYISGANKSLIEEFSKSDIPVVLVINKIDTVKEKETLLKIIAQYSELYKFEAIVPISAKTGNGVNELLKEISKYAVESEPLFPEDIISDQPEKQICAEIVREKLLLVLQHEIPHGTAVSVDKFSERDNGILDMDVTIFCEKQSHKGIIIGKQGATLKKIGEMARKDIEKFMGTKVFLQTWVKVKENWRDSDVLLKNFGFTED